MMIKLMLQAGVCVPVVLWLFLVDPISLRTMHDDEAEPHTGQCFSVIPSLMSHACQGTHLILFVQSLMMHA